MPKNRDLAAAFGVLAVAWVLFGFANGFFAQYLSVSLHLIVWAIMVLNLIFLPLIRSSIRWTALGAGIAGIIMAIWALIEIFFILPPAAMGGPAIGLVFATLLALFALRAYFEKPIS
jgi:hypothetical protein